MRDLAWLRRLIGSLRTRAFEDDMSAELETHLALEVDALLARGWCVAEARIEARRRFGSTADIKDRCRESWGLRAIDGVRQDLRHAGRLLRQNPGYTAAIALTVGVGVGMTTAIFSAVHAVLLQKLPYANGESLVEIHQRSGDSTIDLGVSLPELDDYRRQLSSLDALVEYHQMWFNLIEGGTASRVMTGVVSAGFFDVLGVRPLLGRSFVPADESTGAAPVLIVSHAYWKRALGADPAVIGRAVELNDRVHRIIGVLPPVPPFPEDREPNDVYMPVSACPFHARAAAVNDRNMRIVSAIGRIKPGRTLADLRRELAEVSGTFAARHPESYPGGLEIIAATARDQLTAHARPTLTALMVASLCVLCLVCANVANLILSRLVPRERELRLRRALGASPARLARQLFIEVVVLAAAGGLLGLALAAASRAALTAYAARLSPRAIEISTDRDVVLFAVCATALTSLAFGLLPAWRVARARVASPRRAPGLLILPQIAISFVLLAASLQMTRNLIVLVTSEPGFRSDHVLTARLDLDWVKYASDDARRDFYERLLAIIDGLPGARAAMSLTFPLNDGGSWRATLITGDHDAENASPVDLRLASPGYFDAVGMTVLRGRGFTASDSKTLPAVALVNRTMSLRRFGGDPIGRRMSLDEGRSWVTIVGVVNDVRQYGLDTAAVEELYLPFDRFAPLSATLVVRTRDDPAAVRQRVEDTEHMIDPRQPMSRIRTLDEVRDSSLAPARMTTTLMNWLAALALFISATGVAGVVWFSVNQRTQEIGVRLTLGASPVRIALDVVRSGLGPVVLGIVCGLPAALAFIRSSPGGMFVPISQSTVLAALAAVVTIAVLACIPPARCAASTSPIDALRAE
jgi:putative ABC transport system permease protein